MTPAVLGENPYMGVFFNRGGISTDSVICDVGFPSTNGNNFDSGNWIAGVLSVKGWDSGYTSGYVFQNGFALNDDDEVWWAPQFWNSTGGYMVGSNIEIGDSDYEFFFARMDVDNDNDRIKYRYYSYEDSYDVEHDICVTVTRYKTNADETNFKAGCVWYGSEITTYLEAGVEANENITETTWYVRNGHFGYYSSGWKYKRGDAIRGADTYVGGDTMNADEYSSGAACVTWKKDSTPPATGYDLWTSEGTITQTVSTPFN
jgi:hypothetical protein